MPTNYERHLWREHSRRWRAENPDRAREICRQSYARNAERIRQHRKERREALKAQQADTSTPAESAP